MGLDIGTRLRTVREASGLSQRELASRAGLTNGAISLIEKNRSSPSVSSLKSLLDAIPMSLSEFFAALEQPETGRFFYKADEFAELAPGEGGAAQVSLRQLGDAARHSIQMLHEVYPPGADTGPGMLAHVGEEAGIVIAGRIEITVAGQVGVLESGDGYLFNSQLPHRFRNPGMRDCIIVSACTPPSF